MYQAMQNQAGNRVIISHKEYNRNIRITSHYSDLAEFLRLHDIKNIEWYEVKGKCRIYSHNSIA